MRVEISYDEGDTNQLCFTLIPQTATERALLGVATQREFTASSDRDEDTGSLDFRTEA